MLTQVFGKYSIAAVAAVFLMVSSRFADKKRPPPIRHVRVAQCNVLHDSSAVTH